MNRSLLSNSLMALVIAIAGSVLPTHAQAGFGLHKKSCDSCKQCTNCCPQCKYQCKFDAETVDEEKHCWKVECDVICVPRVVFPWQKSCCDPCTNNGACIKKIRTLHKHKYTCPACEYSWTPEKVGCNNGCCGAGCDSAYPIYNQVDMAEAIEAAPEELPAPRHPATAPEAQRLESVEVQPVR